MPSLMQELMDLDANLRDGLDISNLNASRTSRILSGTMPALHREWRRSAFEFLDGACQNALGEVEEDHTNWLEVKYFPFQTFYLRQYMRSMEKRHGTSQDVTLSQLYTRLEDFHHVWARKSITEAMMKYGTGVDELQGFLLDSKDVVVVGMDALLHVAAIADRHDLARRFIRAMDDLKDLQAMSMSNEMVEGIIAILKNFIELATGDCELLRQILLHLSMRNAESFASKADNEGLNVGSSSVGDLYKLHGQGPEDRIEVEDEQKNRVVENDLESGISGESEAKGIAEPGRPSTGVQSVSGSLETEHSEVRELLNEITSQNVEAISDQVIILVNTSDAEKDVYTLRQFVDLVMENVIGGEKSARLCARLCRKVMEQISPHIIDKDLDRPIAGAQLFRKYLLNICQEKFERIFEREENVDAEGELGMETTHQSSNLVRFVGELFEVQMLTEKIIHGCIKNFLKDIDNPKEAYIESLCALFKVVGKSLDKEKANFHINVYFERMSEISRKENISSRMKSMLLEVIELRQNNWVARSTVQANPISVAWVHEYRKIVGR